MPAPLLTLDAIDVADFTLPHYSASMLMPALFTRRCRYAAAMRAADAPLLLMPAPVDVVTRC